MSTESVKIDSKIVERVRKYIKRTGQTISGYINTNLDRQLNLDELGAKLTDREDRLKKQAKK